MKNRSVRKVLSAEMEAFYYTDNEYHEKHPMLLHRHPGFAEVIYVYEGHGKYRVGNTMYELKPGDVVIVDRNVWHGEEPFLNERNITFTCAMKNIRKDGEVSAIMLNGRTSAVLEFEPGSSVEKLMQVIQEQYNREDVNKPVCNGLCSVLLNIIYERQLREKEQERIPNSDSSRKAPYIDKIVEYLDENYRDVADLKEIGNHFGLNHYYLAHLFKDEMNISPMKYVMRRKIGEAQNLLMNTDAKITEISDALGFSSSGHLYTTFKKYVGVTPKEYRKYYKKKKNETE